MAMKLAIISSYDESCGNATHTKAIEQTFKHQFNVKVFNLMTAALVAHESLHGSTAAENHIDQIAEALTQFDCVNLQLEWCLYGRDSESIKRRLIKLINSSKNIILTLHSLHADPFWYDIQYTIFEVLKARPQSEPYWIIATLPREAEKLRSIFGIDNVGDFPLVYLSEQEVQIYKQADKSAWKESLGFQKDDIVILRAGFLVPHKDHLVSLKSLQLMPPQYKLAFAGGEHPPGMQKNTISSVVKEVTDYLDQHDAPVLAARALQGKSISTLGERVCFLGNLSDEELYTAMACADFVTVTHLESGQSASGIASIAFQLERPIILSYNRFFLEYEKYYRGGFSFFTMGNHYELRDKILNFPAGRSPLLENYGKKYSLNSLAALYQNLYEAMIEGRIHNAGRQTTLALPTLSRHTKIKRKIVRLLPPRIKRAIKAFYNM
jgi:glycosyltransferase involved in cell wall biosynthesis